MKTFIIVAAVCSMLIAQGRISYSAALPCWDVGFTASEEYGRPSLEDLEKKLKELKAELEELQKEASERIRRDLIPLLEKEIDKLKERLREYRRTPSGQPQTRET